MLILGNKEQESRTVSVRLLSGKFVHNVPLQQFAEQARQVNAARQAETDFNQV